jgi:hypothetical protein
MAVYELPNYRLRSCTITPIESVGRSVSGNGTVIGLTETADTMFVCQIETAILPDDLRADWRAWRGKLRGGLDLFSAYDLAKATPLAYPSATASTDISGAWDGTAGVTTLGASGALTLDSLPASYVISAGDPIALEEGGQYAYHIATADATADGSGNVTVNVSPYLFTGIFTTSATARLWQPKATFVIDPSSWSESVQVDFTTISFSGMQRI